jgi:hypothetical protein
LRLVVGGWLFIWSESSLVSVHPTPLAASAEWHRLLLLSNGTLARRQLNQLPSTFLSSLIVQCIDGHAPCIILGLSGSSTCCASFISQYVALERGRIGPKKADLELSNDPAVSPRLRCYFSDFLSLSPQQPIPGLIFGD